MTSEEHPPFFATQPDILMLILMVRVVGRANVMPNAKIETYLLECAYR